jgi:hypothetical protein
MSYIPPPISPQFSKMTLPGGYDLTPISMPGVVPGMEPSFYPSHIPNVIKYPHAPDSTLEKTLQYSSLAVVCAVVIVAFIILLARVT